MIITFDYITEKVMTNAKTQWKRQIDERSVAFYFKWTKNTMLNTLLGKKTKVPRAVLELIYMYINKNIFLIEERD